MKKETLEEADELKYYFENDLEMEQMIKEMALTGKVPKKWSLFISKINNLYKQQEHILEFLYSEITERRDYSASKMCEKVIEFIEKFKNK